MLPFYYTFLIFVLSSSVIAVPTPGPLINNKENLLKRPWARVRLDIVETSAANPTVQWTGDAQYLDDVIRFQAVTVGRSRPRRAPAGVQKVELRRIVRRLQNNQRSGPEGNVHNQYHVSRENGRDRPVKTRLIHDKYSILIKEGSSYLNNTYWGQIPEILGKGRGRHPAGSNEEEDAQYIMHIQWRMDSQGVEVPYVTFTLPETHKVEGKPVRVLKAIECYQLNDKEAKTVQTGDVWRTGFISPTGEVLSSLRGYSYQKDNESRLLLGNTDVRLRSVLQWGRIKLSATETNAVQWTGEAQYLDDTIWFKDFLIDLGVIEVNLGRIQRQLVGHNNYGVVRPHRYYSDGPVPAERLVLLKHAFINKCKTQLDNTYWGLNPHILGEESSGPENDRGYIMHIKWMVGPTGGAEVPHVTFFTPADELGGKHVLKAEDPFQLDDQEAAYVRAGHTYLTGFMSSEEAVSAAMEIMCTRADCMDGQYHYYHN